MMGRAGPGRVGSAAKRPHHLGRLRVALLRDPVLPSGVYCPIGLRRWLLLPHPLGPLAAGGCWPARPGLSRRRRGHEASQLGPLARPGPEAAVEIVIAECSAILLWPF